jgi:hypothetical protein
MGPRRAAVLVLVVALAVVGVRASLAPRLTEEQIAAADAAFARAEAAELAEWRGFFQLAAEALAGDVANSGKDEPSSPWLKTCGGTAHQSP